MNEDTLKSHVPEQVSTHLLRVLYDPMNYYTPWQALAPRLRPYQRSVLNAWLIDRHALPPYREPTPAESRLTRRLLAGWERIPQVVHLLACAKLHRRLAASRLYLAQPAHVHAFLRLPFVPAREEVELQCNSDLVAWGSAYLLRGLYSRVPPWLQARMALQLNLAPEPSAIPAGDEELDFNCFWSAWNHAADLSRKTA